MTAAEPPVAASQPAGRAHKRLGSLFVVLVLGAALVGYLRGTVEPPPLARPAHAAHAPSATTRLAPNYAQLMTDRSVPPASVGPFDPVVRTEEMKRAALADRAKNRAFDTAPPTIPHPTDGMRGAAACLACHGTGLKVGDRVASKVSHPHFTNCVQCHAAGAPPTVPHTTWMRQDCTSCHGTVSRPGLTTPHPWLTNCTQCHAPSAALDQVAFPLPPNGGAP